MFELLESRRFFSVIGQPIADFAGNDTLLGGAGNDTSNNDRQDHRESIESLLG
jgi:hypothetical protein